MAILRTARRRGYVVYTYRYAGEIIEANARLLGPDRDATYDTLPPCVIKTREVIASNKNHAIAVALSAALA